jgi:hypothetical protein
LLALTVACSSPTTQKPDLNCNAVQSHGLGSTVCDISWFECDNGLTYTASCEVGGSPPCSCYIDGGLVGQSDAGVCAEYQTSHPSLLTVINETCGWCIGTTCPKR